ncbi:hypothetical protein DDZ14_16500 [Maritimibacter sp. 55A14]|uniref:hypothetical protein n=1 Tax=Maritimibacter sp. 55A14 TaxID=2174844 RepID=UPI000D619CDC|nr:hypothetical protein [Maritimibacter sp. 55A14]PWE29931.1 hypothetical protein DDZ14_16500 [Maritimibacter sp. 55A14]
MLVRSIEVADITYEPEATCFNARVMFRYETGDARESGTAHFHCRAELDPGTAQGVLREALIAHARRQMRWMPEIMTGAEDLVFAEDAESLAA